jgi:hypothetical protein
MANSDKNISITPNKGQSSEPEISFVGFANTSIKLKVKNDSDITFENNTQQLFRIESDNSSSKLSITSNIDTPSVEITSDGLAKFSKTTEIGGDALVLPNYTTSLPKSERGLLTYSSTNKSVYVSNGTEWKGTKNDIVRGGLQCWLDARNAQSFSDGLEPDYQGTTVHWLDLSGNNRNFVGNSRFLSSNGGLKSGSAFTMQKYQDQILNRDEHTICFSIKFRPSPTFPNATTGSWQKIFEHTSGGSDRSPGIWRYPSERRLHWRYDPSNSGCDFGKDSSSNEFDLETWYFVGVSRDGLGTCRCFVNGTLVNVASTSLPKITGIANINLFNGYSENIAHFDDLMIYNRALSDFEMYQNYLSVSWKYAY